MSTDQSASWLRKRLELLERLELAFVFMERASFLRYRRINTLYWSDPVVEARMPRVPSRYGGENYGRRSDSNDWKDKFPFIH